MLNFLFGLHLIFGSLVVFFASKSICNLLYIFLIYINKSELKATVIDYKEIQYYTKRTPRRSIHNYFPKIMYQYSQKTQMGYAYKICNKTNKMYNINDSIIIFCNKKRPSQFFIKNNLCCFSDVLCFVLAIVYLAVLFFIAEKLYVQNYSIINSFIVCLFISLLIIVIVLFLNSLKGYINENKVKIFSILQVIIYGCLLAINWLYLFIH